MHKVIINGKAHYATDGTLLSEVLLSSGLKAEHPCGGRGTCKKCVVVVNGKEELSCQYIIKSDIAVEFSENNEIFSNSGADESEQLTENLCFALDIGTTTLALALVSLDAQRIIRVLTRTNPQRAFGADVMTRIDYCRKYGVSKLKNAVISEINSMISEFNIQKPLKLFVSGNTTMLHLFFGIDCSAIGVAPYTPSFLESRTEKGKSLGISFAETAEALPSIAAFVGADIVAGLNFTAPPENGRYNLLIDLGTNAEIVLYSESSVLCTAAAAGPCFEGANISCGMSATPGAIYSYSRKEIKTIENLPAKGICGTGLIDIISVLLCEEAIDETGFMEETVNITDTVSINQSDIRQYQLAKSAVYSAVMTLLQIKNVSFDQIDKMYISGGFSAKINIANAVITGLLPKELADKCIPINNSSLLGTVKYILEKNNLTAYIDNAAYIDLSANSVFSELFIENMSFDTDY